MRPLPSSRSLASLAEIDWSDERLLPTLRDQRERNAVFCGIIDAAPLPAAGGSYDRLQQLMTAGPGEPEPDGWAEQSGGRVEWGGS